MKCLRMIVELNVYFKKAIFVLNNFKLSLLTDYYIYKF